MKHVPINEELRDHIRLRPGMYIGGVDQRALHRMLESILEGCAQEAMVGRCQSIHIELREDGEVFIADDGLGLPVDFDEVSGLSNLERLMRIHSLRKTNHGAERYELVGGSFGIGFIALNALSTYFIVETVRSGYLWRQRYEQGLPVSGVERVRSATDQDIFNLMITYQPDPQILEVTELDWDELVERCVAIAYTAPGVNIKLIDRRDDKTITIRMHDGLRDLVSEPSPDYETIGDVFYEKLDLKLSDSALTDPAYRVQIEFALQFCSVERSKVFSYINSVPTLYGGSHVMALQSSVANAIQLYLMRNAYKFSVTNVDWQRLPIGYRAAISILHPDPEYSAARYTALLNDDIYIPIAKHAFEAFSRFLKNGRHDEEAWKDYVGRDTNQR